MSKTIFGKLLADVGGMALKTVAGSVGINTGYTPQSAAGNLLDKANTFTAPIRNAVASTLTGGATAVVQGIGSNIQAGNGVSLNSLVGVGSNLLSKSSFPSLTVNTALPKFLDAISFKPASFNPIPKLSIVEAPLPASSRPLPVNIIATPPAPASGKSSVLDAIKDYGKEALEGAKSSVLDKWLETDAGKEAKTAGAVSFVKDLWYVWLALILLLAGGVVYMVGGSKKRGYKR